MRNFILGIGIGIILSAALMSASSYSQSAWGTAEFGKGLGLVVASCGGQSLTPGTYTQLTLGTGGTGC